MPVPSPHWGVSDPLTAVPLPLLLVSFQIQVGALHLALVHP